MIWGQILLAVLQFLFQLLKNWGEKKAEAEARVKASEKEKAEIAELIVKKQSGKLAQKSRNLRLVVRELLNDPKLREDIAKVRSSNKAEIQ